MSTSASPADNGVSRSSLTLLSRVAASSAASTEAGNCPSRNASAVRMRAGAGRRNRWTISSSDASSAQWMSSSTTTTGCRTASCWSSARTARWARKRSSLVPAERHVAARGGRRQHPGELGRAIPDQRLDAIGSQRGHVVVERRHPDTERQRALHLRSTPDQHQMLARVRASAELRQQTRLAGARLAGQRETAGARGSQRVQRSLQARQLLTTAHEGPGSKALRLGHALSLTALRARGGNRSGGHAVWRGAWANARHPAGTAGSTTTRLAALVREGDTRAFEALYDRHHAPLLAFCRHMLGSLQDGEDALQQTFLRAHRALSDRPPPDAVRPWLFAIARNRCRTLLAARAESTVALEDFEPSFDGLAEDVGRRADLRELVQDLARLPEDQREALVLFELGGSSQSEIARVLACPPAKVKALVFQARSTLIAERDARSTPCEAIREQLAVARGGVLRRGSLRRHLRQCAPCDAYRLAVAGQRDALASLLPVLPSAGLKAAVLAAAGLSGGGGSAAAAAGGAASLGGVAAGGGAASAGGLAVTALVAKVAVTVAVAGAGVSGAVAAVGSGSGDAAPEIRAAVPTPARTAQARRPAPAPTRAEPSAGAEPEPATAPAQTVGNRAISRRRAIRRHRARRAAAAFRHRARRRAALRRRLAASAPRREARRAVLRREARSDVRQQVRRRLRRRARREAAGPDGAPSLGSRPALRRRPATGTKPVPVQPGARPVRPRRKRPAPLPAPEVTATPTATPAATATRPRPRHRPRSRRPEHPWTVAQGVRSRDSAHGFPASTR